MLNYKGSQFQTSTNDTYHDESFEFTEEKGFQMAFGIVEGLNPEARFEEYFDVAVFTNSVDQEG